MKRFLSILLSSCILFSAAAPMAYAVEATQDMTVTADASIYEDLPSEAELFSSYVDQAFFGGVATFGTAAREYLNSVEQQIYDKLKAVIVDVAANGGSTEITINAADLTGLTYSWASGTDAMAEFENQVSVYRIWHALIHDCPYDLYWLDRGQDNMSMGMTTVDDGTNVTIEKLNFIFFVSMNYQPAFNQKTTVKSDVAAVAVAAEKAREIVDKYAQLDDYSKLVSYKDEICALVKYDTGAVDGNSDYVTNASWQLINVFDSLPATNVVSDGYTKAFQYLCDLSEFDSIRCYSVKGTIDNADFMWNIVTMEDGKTYLLDVTNSDTGREGEYGQFFLAGYDDGGRWSGFVVNGHRYAYHSSTLFDINTLILADKDYLYIPQGTAHYGQCGDNVYWLLNEDGTLTITGWGDMWSEYSTSDTSSVLPPWHAYVKEVKKIVIEPGVTSISDYRFYLCQYAETATIPDTVTTIGEMAFYSCMALKELTVPDSVTSLGMGAFGNCSSLEKITLSQNITAIPDWLLNSAAITEIVIPEGVTSIGDNAFYGCNSLAYVTMPAAVTTVGASSFNTYPDDVIKEVFFKGSEEQWNAITFDEYNDILQAYIHFGYNPDATFTITVAECENGTVTTDKSTAKYGDTVTVTTHPAEEYQRMRIFVNGAETKDSTFMVRGNITVSAEFIYIGDKVIAYGTCGDNLEWTLKADGTLTITGTGKMTDFISATSLPWAGYAKSIKTVVINDGVASIGDYAFNGCTALEQITIPDSVQSIGSNTFQNCISLKSISIPEGVTAIGMSTFANCTSLGKVIIPNSVNVIANKAFSGCTSLKQVKLPQHSLNIYSYAFANCMSLDSIHIYRKDGDASYIDEYAFYGCTVLKSATLEGMRYLGPSAFSGCTGLEQVIINTDGVPTDFVQLSEINQSTFNGCNRLKTVYIPITVTTVETSAFNGCTSLTDVYYEGLRDQWQQIEIQQKNDSLLAANIICNQKPPVQKSVVMRVSGSNRYETSIAIADFTKEITGVEKFNTIIVASGENFADALAGTYLADVKDAPIILAKNGKNDAQVKEYIDSNLASGGKVYILGSTKTIPQSTEDALAAYDVKRLWGDTRYDTNIKILEEAGVAGQEILVCSGEIFADSLSASAAGKPILLVNTKKDSLTEAQKEYLATIGNADFCIIGSTRTISSNLAAEIDKYGEIDRVWGETRYETSVAVAERFFTNPDTVIFAGGTQFPDGLCGGALATSVNAPIILANSITGKFEAARDYVQDNDVHKGAVLGGTMHIDDATAMDIFDTDKIVLWK